MGWSEIPEGYGATFEVSRAPMWLRILHGLPFVDRFAYPLLVARGYGMLRAHPGLLTDALGPVTGGWRVEPTPPNAS